MKWMNHRIVESVNYKHSFNLIYLGLCASYFDTGKGIGHVMVVFPFAQLAENVGWK